MSPFGSIPPRAARRWLVAAAIAAAALGLASCGGKSSPAAPDAGPGPGPGPGPGGGSSPGDSARWAVIDGASSLYHSLRGDPTRDAATLAYLTAQPNVEAAGVSDSLDNLWARFDDERLLLLIDNRLPAVPVPPSPAREGQRRLAERLAMPPPLGSELPVSDKARLMNSLEPSWHSSVGPIGTMLGTSGYAVSTPASGLAELAAVQGDGVFYWASHAGEGNDRQGNGVFGIWTQSLCDSVRDRVSPVSGHWGAKEICYACTGVYQPDGSVRNECHYAITPEFIRNKMSFSANSLVYIDACTSAKQEVRDAFFARGAGLYCGWDVLTSGSSWIVGETLFDLLCGADHVVPQTPRQRPFLFDWVREWMVSQQKNRDPGGTARLYMNRNPTNPTFGLLRPTIFRLFVHNAPSDPQDYLEIEGDFGLDPGAANRAVTIGGVALTGVVWGEHLITVPLPLTGASSHGDVTVSVRGHLSNVAQLTRWVVPFVYRRYGPGSLQQEIHANYVVRGDASNYRNIPYAIPNGFPHAVVSSKASGGSFLMSGIYRPDPDHYIKWLGSGTLGAPTTIPQATQPGHVLGAGNLNPGARTIASFQPQAYATYTIETESSSSTATASISPFTTVTLTFGTNYVIRADSTSVSLSDGSATLRWGPATPAAPFNDGGR